jgi:antitoxin VapB
MYIPYIHGMTKPVHTKTFKSGNSVAVRLPKGFAIAEGVEVELDKSGDVVTIRLAGDPAEEKARLLKMLDELYALPKPPRVQEREPILFPKRRGL